MRDIFDNIVFDQAFEITKAWDFELAKQKLIESESGWTQERADKAVLSYQRYMAVTQAIGGQQLVPNGDIDKIWHMHILDTRAYMRDCQTLFGEYLHHYPYFGMLDEQNHQQWLGVQYQSEQLWKNLFAEPLYISNAPAQKCPQACPCHINVTATVSNSLPVAANA